MHPKTRHHKLLENKRVNRWYENLKAKSLITAETYLRNFGLWLEYLDRDPDSIIEFAKTDFDEFKGSVSDKIRKLEKKGIAGSSISTSVKPMMSYLKFNNVIVKLNINIKNENRNFNAERETVPDKENLSTVLRHASVRERVSISLMAFSGLRPEVLGNIDGTDGIRLSDIPDLSINGKSFEFQRIPVQINVRAELSKIRQPYFTFLGDEGCKYLSEYLEERVRQGHTLDSHDPVIMPESDMQRNKKSNEFLMTTLILRRIKSFIVQSGYSWRPYIFRVYFGTNLDTAESKGLISHPWRQFIMGHKGDIEETYTKRAGLLEDGRDAYVKCLPYLETKSNVITEIDKESLEKNITSSVLKKLGFSDKDIDEMVDMDDEEFQKAFREKRGMALNNGHRQKVIPQTEIKHYIEDLGWEYVKDLNAKESIVKLPD